MIERTILFTIFTAWLSLVVLFQSFLLYFILRHSPKSFRTFRILLADTSVCQLLTVVICYFNQLALVTNGHPMIELKSYGLCRFCEPEVCTIAYLVDVLLVWLANTGILATFYYKYLSVVSVVVSDTHVLASILICHIPVFPFLGLEFWFFTETRRPFTPTGNLDDFLVFAVVPEGARSYFTINVLLASGSFTFPIICWYIRRRILREVNMKVHIMSATKRAQHKTFVMGLTIQVTVPALIYPPAYALFYLYYLNDKQLPLADLYTFYMASVPPLIDPFVSLYFVTPFRKTMQGWMKNSTLQVSPISKT